MARYEPLPYVRQSRPRNLRLADLYLRSGEQQAESIRRSGEIQAALWGNVGNTIGQTAAQIVQAPQLAREQAARETEQAQRAKLGALQLGAAERDVTDRENFDLAMSAGGGSRQKTLAFLQDRPELYEKAKSHFDKIDTSLKQLMGDAAAGIREFGDSPEAAMAAMDDLIDQGFDERKMEQFRAAIQRDPASVKQIVNALLSQSPDPKHQQMAKPLPMIELNRDTSLFDPNQGRVVASGPQSPPPREPLPPNPTEASLAAAAAAGDRDAARALALLRAQHPPSVPAADNVLVPIVGPDGKTRYGTRQEARGSLVPSGSEKPSSGVQKRVLNFFNRAQQADKDLESMEGGIQQLDLGGQAWMQFMPNFLQTDLGQQYTQAQRAFTEARLRKDSGAAIPEAEFANDRRTYFAQPGDSKATLEQKRRARATMLASLGFEAGQALTEFTGDAEEAKALVDAYRARARKPGDQPPLQNGETVSVGGFTVRVKPKSQ